MEVPLLLPMPPASFQSSESGAKIFRSSKAHKSIATGLHLASVACKVLSPVWTKKKLYKINVIGLSIPLTIVLHLFWTER